MKKKTEDEIYQLLADKWLSGTITQEEKFQLFEYYDQPEAEDLKIPARFAGAETEYREFLFAKLNAKLKLRPIRKTKRFHWAWSAAAVVFLAIFIFSFLKSSNLLTGLSNDKTVKSQLARKNSPQLPAIILNDGSVISLSKERLAAISHRTGLKIDQDSTGKFVYTVAGSTKTNGPNHNEVVTPKGQQFTINLSDGTRVCLNAGSSLKFPTAFSASERTVTLIGEAYFEVAKDRKKPFKVITRSQQIEVLGTHFNVNAYLNEAVVKTTLVEGSVKVKASGSKHQTILKPGEQSTLGVNGLKVAPVDIDAVLAWRTGYFKFTDEDLESIMRKLQRWYDVEVVFEGENNPNLTFAGKISQAKSITSILKIIEETGNVNFKVSGRRITVLNNKK